MDIAVTDVGIVLLSSSKKHARTVQLKGRRDDWGTETGGAYHSTKISEIFETGTNGT